MILHLIRHPKPVVEPGIVRMMSQEGYYTGYTLLGARQANLGKGECWALGDNSANSSDSRNWGVVPEENIVGRAAFPLPPGADRPVLVARTPS